jgi:hypothetical protein
VRDEKNNPVSVSVKLCDHFDQATEDNIAAIAAVGIPVEYTQASSEAEEQQ